MSPFCIHYQWTCLHSSHNMELCVSSAIDAHAISTCSVLQIPQTPTSSAFSSTIPEYRVAITAPRENARFLAGTGSPVEENGSGDGMSSWITTSEAAPLKQCSICYGSFPLSAYPLLDKNMKCKHAACVQCYRLYLTVQITESRVRKR